MIVPEFTPSLLCLLVLLPAIVGKLKEEYNGKAGNDFGETDGAALILGCLALLMAFVGTPVALVYSVFPRFFQFGQFAQQRLLTIVIGGVLVLVGITLTCWARLVLAGNWVGGPFLREEHRLITVGPYRLIRHPMYSGFAVFHIGLLVATGSIIPLLSDGPMRVLLLRQTLSEERLLIKRFGQVYLDYKNRTGRFLPKLTRGVK